MRRYVHEVVVATSPEKQAAGARAQTEAFVRFAEGL